MRELIFCPDCQQTLEMTADEFVAHRQAKHPPEPKTLVVEGVVSQERVHGE
jgi:hypothetical protein